MCIRDRHTGRGAKGILRPQLWLCGPDEYKHDMYIPWLRAKAQANFRGEGWSLSFEEYYDLWKNDWNNRGRKADNVCMTRKDADSPWDVSNVMLITRKEHLAEQGRQRTGQSMRYKPRYNKMKVTK